MFMHKRHGIFFIIYMVKPQERNSWSNHNWLFCKQEKTQLFQHILGQIYTFVHYSFFVPQYVPACTVLYCMLTKNVKQWWKETQIVFMSVVGDLPSPVIICSLIVLNYLLKHSFPRWHTQGHILLRLSSVCITFTISLKCKNLSFLTCLVFSVIDEKNTCSFCE